MREITSHKVNIANDQIKIEVIDDEGAGGANHHYHITGFDTGSNPSCPFMDRYGKPADHATILFQNGPIKESGVNGITQEVLLAICIDRLKSFQNGPYSCRENALALTKLEEAVMWLNSRTQRRVVDGTEGTHRGK